MEKKMKEALTGFAGIQLISFWDLHFLNPNNLYTLLCIDQHDVLVFF